MSEEFFKELEQEEQSATKLQLQGAQQKDPGKMAEVYQLSDKTGFPADYVERNTDKVKAEQVDYDDLQKSAPLLSEFLRNRRNAQIAHDDLENLKWWEVAGKEAGNILKIGPAAAKSISSAGYSTLSSAFDVLSDVTTGPLSRLGLMSDSAGMAADYLQNIARAERARGQEYFAKPGETYIPAPVFGGVQSAITNVPALLAGALTRSPNVALGLMGGMTYGTSYLEARDAGLDKYSAIAHGVNQSIAEMATERLPAVKLLDDIGADAGFFKTVAKQMALEIPSEQVATIWQDANDWAALNPDKTLDEFMAERKDAAIDTLISTVVATGLQTGVMTGVNQYLDKQQKDATAQIIERAIESKLRGRDMELFQEHIQQAAGEGGIVENVYLNAVQARALFQDMKDDDAKQV
ncbi:MAG: hypothetical protein P8Y45_04830, partial [Exilibacterium sp.]